MKIYDGARDGYKMHDRLVLVGPPGTGKTYASMNGFILPALSEQAEILACSFSRAAAEEIRLRCAQALNRSPSEFRFQCSTVHSEALRRIGGGVKLYDKGVAREKSIDDDVESIMPAGTSYMRVWDKARSLMIHDDWDAVAGLCTGEREPVADILRDIRDYEEAKQEAGAIDFTDMLLLALSAPTVSRDLLLVDEVQDTSPLQWALIERWARHARHVVLVGDPDQAIHEWMGAYPEKLNSFIRSTDWEVRQLSKSFRVPETAYEMARVIITQDPKREDAPYEPTEVGGTLEHLSTDEGVPRAILGSSGSCFVLCRTGKRLGYYAEILMDAGIPFRSQYGRDPFRSKKNRLAAYAALSLKERGWADPDSVRALLDNMPAKRIVGTKKAAVAQNYGEEDAVVPLEDVPLVDTPELSHLKLDGWKKDAYENYYKIVGLSAFIDDPRVVLSTMHASKGREADLP